MSLFGPGGDEINLEDAPAVAVSRDFRHADPRLLVRWKELLEAFGRKFPEREVLVTCVYRSPAAQWKLWQRGRFGNPGPMVVDCDGRTTRSPLNYYPSRALHAIILERGIPVEDEPPYYPLGALARHSGLIWRGLYNEQKPVGSVLDKTLFELADA